MSSDSSSDNESVESRESSPFIAHNNNKNNIATTTKTVSESGTEDSAAEEEEEKPTFTKPTTVNTEQAFNDFYLRQATKEFANDLDKLRSASDFNARSVPMLVGALKQGGACFTKEERARVGVAMAK